MLPFNGYGSYLVRDSDTTPGDYSLSVRDREQVMHYRIRRLDNGRFFVTRRATFNTVQDLVAYYRQQADGLCTNLTKPCTLSEKPQTAGLSRQTNYEWEIDRKTIRFIRKLMSNEFTEDWEGLWNGTTCVAIKTLRPQQIITASDFLQTANLTKKIRHRNIIQLYAVCTKEDPVYIVTEYMKHNSLLECLRGEGRSLKLPQLIDMASQVAAGMAYLEKQSIIHRDLSAKNVLVGENFQCKVTNFDWLMKTSMRL